MPDIVFYANICIYIFSLNSFQYVILISFIYSSFRDSTYGEGGEGGMSQEDNYPPGMQHQNDQNGIDSSIDQIFEGIFLYQLFVCGS